MLTQLVSFPKICLNYLQYKYIRDINDEKSKRHTKYNLYKIIAVFKNVDSYMKS